jgi:hypothetical protein
LPLFSAEIYAQDHEEGLIGYYTFSGNARDQSGQENHGQIKRIWPDNDVFTGQGRGSFRFGGKKNHVKFSIDINPIVMPEMTFTAWVKTSYFPRGNQNIMTIFSQDDGGFDRALKVRWNSTAKEMELFAHNGKEETKHLLIDRASWTFVAVVYDQNKQNITLYANEKKLTAKGEIVHGNDYFLIGACPRSKHYFRGSIDDVRLYNRALTEAEINTLFRLKAPYEEPAQAEREYIYIVSSNSLPVREKMDETSRVIGSFARNDTITNAEVMTNPANNERVVSFELEPGKTGFVAMRYLNRVDITKTGMDRFRDKYLDARSWYFWVILVGLLVLAGIYIAKFKVIDEFMIYQANSSKYPGIPWLPAGAILLGAIMGAVIVFWQTDTEAFFNTPLLWPKGHALHTWLLWLFMIAMIGGVIGSAVESFIKAGPVWGLLRLALILLVSVLAFFSTMIISAMLIVITIVILVGLGLLSAAFSKRVYRDKAGNLYEEI